MLRRNTLALQALLQTSADPPRTSVAEPSVVQSAASQPTLQDATPASGLAVVRTKSGQIVKAPECLDL